MKSYKINGKHTLRVMRQVGLRAIYPGAQIVADYKKFLPEFIRWYNYLRPHQALRYQAPGEALGIRPYGYVDKATSILPHIPSQM